MVYPLILHNWVDLSTYDFIIATILLPYTISPLPASKLNQPSHEILFFAIFPNYFGRKLHTLGKLFPSAA